MLGNLSRDGNSLESAELNIIREIMDTYHVATYLEIGTYRGYSSFGVYDLVVLKFDGYIISVDILEGTEGWNADEHIAVHEANELYKKKNRLDNITFLTCGSDAFFASNQDKFDCVLIDGEHSYEQVKRDLVNALEIVVDNGILIMHDINHPEIQKSIDEIDASKYETQVLRGVKRVLVLRVNRKQK